MTQRRTGRDRGRFAGEGRIQALFRDLYAGIFLLAASAMLIAAIGVGGWHLYRYVLAPSLDLVSSEEQLREQVQIATSPFRTLSEKRRALDRIVELREHVDELEPAERRAGARALTDVVRMPDYALEIKYKAARAQAILSDRPLGSVDVGRRPPVTEAVGREFEARLSRLRALTAVTGTEFREGSSDRTRLLVGLFREDPCDADLHGVLRDLAERERLPTVERSFVFGMLSQRRDLCS